MNVYIIIGPQAVGKMTVGQELAKITGAKLFYNHLTIDLVSKFYPYGSRQGDYLVKRYRNIFFDTVSEDKSFPGLIFTYVCDFNQGTEYLDELIKKFEKHTVFIIELMADYTIRKERNISDNRLLHKESKRNIPESVRLFEKFEVQMRTTSFPGEINFKNYLRLNNEAISPNDAAKKIISYFNIQ